MSDPSHPNHPAPAGEDWTFPFPAIPHVPGATPRPDATDPVFAIARAAPDPTDPAQWRDNPAWRAGLFLYGAGCYWEAHEVWEAVWARARPNSPERMLVQGVIQLANAGLKQQMRRPRAAMRLAALALSHVEDAATGGGDPVMGLDPRALAAAIAAHLTVLAGDPAAPPPRLHARDPDAP